MEKKQPYMKLNIGKIHATVWSNKIKDEKGEKEFKSVNIEKRYKDGEDWKSTNSYNLTELGDLSIIANAVRIKLSEKE